jgi:hypothetical protein
MKEISTAFGDAGGAVATMNFMATDITNTMKIEARDIQCGAPVSAVTKSLAASMHLPVNTPWALRSDSTSEFLDDFRPIGDVIAPDSSVTVVPKTHLG